MGVWGGSVCLVTGFTGEAGLRLPVRQERRPKAPCQTGDLGIRVPSPLPDKRGSGRLQAGAAGMAGQNLRENTREWGSAGRDCSEDSVVATSVRQLRRTHQ